MAQTTGGQVDTVMQEGRLFPPPAEFAAKARIGSLAEYEELWNEAAGDIENFWGELAGELHWFKPYYKVLEWNEPFAKWFVGGKTNASYNCLDVHLGTAAAQQGRAHLGRGAGRPARRSPISNCTARSANSPTCCERSGIKQGDVVSIYMPMVPELVIAMLACARIGAVHSVIFGGFSSEAIADRNNDAQAKLVITADGGWRRGQQLPLKANVDEALTKSPTVKKCIVRAPRRQRCPHASRPRSLVARSDGRRVAPIARPCRSIAKRPLFILYTSGSTGKPKGIKHTTAGYNLFVKKTFEWVFDHRDEDVFWCTADCGWVTGHSYVVYGPLSAGATVLMYEGAPNWPDEGRFWRDHREVPRHDLLHRPDRHPLVHQMGRSLGRQPRSVEPAAAGHGRRRDQSRSLDVVSPQDRPRALPDRRYLVADRDRRHHDEPAARRDPHQAGQLHQAAAGHRAGDRRRSRASRCQPGQGGWLVITKPWPGMLRGIWGDDERYKEQYWSQGAAQLSGRRQRPPRRRRLLLDHGPHRRRAERGRPSAEHDRDRKRAGEPSAGGRSGGGRPARTSSKGEAVAVFVTLKSGAASDALREELKQHVRKEIGALAQPDDIRFTAPLPKTRSGKIMRRLLRDIASRQRNRRRHDDARRLQRAGEAAERGGVAAAEMRLQVRQPVAFSTASSIFYLQSIDSPVN